MTNRTGAKKDEAFAVHGNKAELTKLTYESVRTLEDLVRVCDIDTETWEVERWVANVWESASGTGDDLVVTPQFQVKANLRLRVALLDTKAEIASLLEDAKAKAPVRVAATKPSVDSGYMLEVNVPDLHIGKLAWREETGDNYDTKIAGQVFRDAVTALLQRSKAYKFERIVLPVGNDLLHSDTKAGTTTSGTYLDTDSRYQKNFREARQAITWAIDACRKIAPVSVIMVPGNHDELSVWHLGDSLEAYFHNTEDVEIDNEPKKRKYHEFGQNMLLFTHGDKGKHNDYPLLMATEKPEMFGRTRYREAHVGHLHQTRVQEFHGVRVRIVTSLSGSDAWHSDNAFTGNIRGAEAFVWNYNEGLISSIYYNLPLEF